MKRKQCQIFKDKFPFIFFNEKHNKECRKSQLYKATKCITTT